MNIDLKYIIKRIIVGVCVGMILISYSKVVNAAEIKYYDDIYTINNTRYYKYKLPDRVYAETGKHNSVSMSIYDVHNGYGYQNTLLGNSYNYYLDYSKDYNYNGYSVSTEQFKNPIYPSLNPQNSNWSVNLNLAFSGGFPTDTASMIESAYNMDYSKYYDFKFTISLKSRKTTITNILENYLTNFGGFTNDLGTNQYDGKCFPKRVSGGYGSDINTNIVEYSCYRVKFINIDDLNDDSLKTYVNNQVVKQEWLLKPTSFNISYNGSDLSSFMLTQGYSNSWIGSGSRTPLNGFYTYTISAPYDLYFYSEYDKYIVNKVWTQEESENINENPINGLTNYSQDADSFIESLYNYATFEDGGITQTLLAVVNTIRGGINNSCHSLTINMLGKDIMLPNGCDFWRRQDISTFNIMWRTTITALLMIGFIRILYKDFITVINPNRVIKDVNDL